MASTSPTLSTLSTIAHTLDIDEATIQALAGPIGSLDVLSAPAELLPSTKNRFGFAWPVDLDHSVVAPAPAEWASPPTAGNNAETSSSEVDAESSDASDAGAMTDPPPLARADSVGTETTSVSNTFGDGMPPRLSRAFSTPLPAQLKHLRHPSRNSLRPMSPIPMRRAPSPFEKELSLELADCVQTVLQTLLQLSPPHLLDPAREQFSACALQFPTPSVSALLTIMKNLNYMSANLSSFSPVTSEIDGNILEEDEEEPVVDEFDVGEMVQSVGDVLGGIAAEAGIELVLFHVDVGMKHVSVKGDECAMTYILLHVLQQIVATTRKGDTVELGLHIAPRAAEEHTLTPGRTSPLADVIGGGVACQFVILHKFSEASADPSGEPRATPRFDSGILKMLLKRIGATLTHGEPSVSHGRTFEFVVTLAPGPLSALTQPPMSAEEQAVRQPFPTFRLAQEPTLDELASFAETQLRGKKAVFYAAESSSFAHHLTSYLTTWGLDLSYVSTDPAKSDSGLHSLSSSRTSSAATSPNPQPNPFDEITPLATPSILPTTPGRNPARAETTFLIIDDDVDVLRTRLHQIRAETPSLNLTARSKRPSLASNHRPRSTAQIKQALSAIGNPPIVVVHFTSLANYKLVKDAVQSILLPPNSQPFQLPEILVIPKPAGPRRFLTALHTAINRPLVDPFFSPIATSPMSPGGSHLTAMNFSHRLSHRTTPSTPGRQRSEFVRNSPRSPRDHTNESLPPVTNPSPLNIEALEYFSETAARLNGGSAASGMVIQSPDGRPAGIFFQPPSRQGSARGTPPSRPMERTALQRTASGLSATSRRSSVEGQKSTTESAQAQLPNERLASKAPSTPDRRVGGGDGKLKLSPTLEKAELSSAAPSTAPSPSRASSNSRRGSNSATERPKVDAADDQAATSTDKVSPAARGGRLATIEMKEATPPASPLGAQGSASSVGTVAASPQGRRPLLKKPVVAATKDGKSSKSKLADGTIVPPISVLIVEDNPINQTILKTFMMRRKIKYGLAKNGQEAVDQWRTGSFHLILMDIQMPVKDGIEATKEIRALEKSSNIGIFPATPPVDDIRAPSPSADKRASFLPTKVDAQPPPPSPFRSSVIIVALTASSLQADRVAALAAGCNDFLTKPVSLPWLDKKIIEWGSIKALQMWADPEMVRNFASGQDAKAKALQLSIVRPPRTTPSPKLAPSNLSKSTSPSRLGSSLAPAPRTASPVRALAATLKSPAPPVAPAPKPAASKPASENDGASEKPNVLPEKVIHEEPSEISGEEALRRHIADSQHEADIQATAQHVVLGARSLSNSAASLLQILHDPAAPTVDTPDFSDTPDVISPVKLSLSPATPPVDLPVNPPA